MGAAPDCGWHSILLEKHTEDREKIPISGDGARRKSRGLLWTYLVQIPNRHLIEVPNVQGKDPDRFWRKKQS